MTEGNALTVLKNLKYYVLIHTVLLQLSFEVFYYNIHHFE